MKKHVRYLKIGEICKFEGIRTIYKTALVKHVYVINAVSTERF